MSRCIFRKVGALFPFHPDDTQEKEDGAETQGKGDGGLGATGSCIEVSPQASLSRMSSLTSHVSDFQSVLSEDAASFHSLSGPRSREGSSDFQSMTEDQTHRDRSDSFSSLGESSLSFHRALQHRLTTRRNSVYSITSATHSLAPRVDPSFVTIHDDSASLTDRSSVHEKGMNLNVGAMAPAR